MEEKKPIVIPPRDWGWDKTTVNTEAHMIQQLIADGKILRPAAAPFYIERSRHYKQRDGGYVTLRMDGPQDLSDGSLFEEIAEMMRKHFEEKRDTVG